MSDDPTPLVLGVGGTGRPGSATERAVRWALARAEARGARVRMIDGAALAALPLYAPGAQVRTRAEQDFVEAVRAADGLIVGSPAYHGGMSGLVKNAIDLVEETARDPRPYFDGRAVGLVVVSTGWQAVGGVLSGMRGVVHALRGWPTPMGAGLNAGQGPLFDEDGRCLDPAADRALTLVADQVVDFALRWRA